MSVGCQIQMSQLWYRPTVLNVGGIAARAEDTTDLHLGVRVCRGNERACSVVNEGCELDRDSLGLISIYLIARVSRLESTYPLAEGGLKHRHYIMAFDTGNIEPFSPPL